MHKTHVFCDKCKREIADNEKDPVVRGSLFRYDEVFGNPDIFHKKLDFCIGCARLFDNFRAEVEQETELKLGGFLGNIE